MNLDYYIHFFHDGSLEDIRHKNGVAEFVITSCELLPEENRDDIRLDHRNRVRGRLCVSGIRQILINDKPYNENLEAFMMQHDDAEILDFDIRRGLVEFGIQWNDYRPTPGPSEFSLIQITANQIAWEDRFTGQQTDVTNIVT